MLRRWLSRTSPAIANPCGNTTLLGKGRMREVIGQTRTNPVLRVKVAGDTTRAGRRPAFHGQGRIEIRPNEFAGVRCEFQQRHSSIRSRPWSGPQSSAAR